MSDEKTVVLAGKECQCSGACLSANPSDWDKCRLFDNLAAQIAIPKHIYSELARGLEVLEEEYGTHPRTLEAWEWLKARAQRPVPKPPKERCNQ